MNLQWRGAAALAAASIPFLTTAAWSRGPEFYEPVDSARAANRTEDAIVDWPAHSRNLAEAVMQEYGPPDGTEQSRLSWEIRRPWKMIVVYRDAPASGRPNGLQQSVAYEVSVRKWRELGAFDRGVDYDPVNHELIAHNDSEMTNVLALNLADEVIRGRRSAVEAREFYDKTLALSYAGKSSSYTRKLLFRPRRLPEPSLISSRPGPT
jgi:hypothetical protein